MQPEIVIRRHDSSGVRVTTVEEPQTAIVGSKPASREQRAAESRSRNELETDCPGQTDSDGPRKHSTREDRGCGPAHEIALPSMPKSIPVPPSRELRPARFADAHQVESFPQARNPDVLGRRPHRGLTKQALAVLNRLPAFFQRGQVPAPAAPAHHPQSPAHRIECQPATHGEGLDDLVGAEGLVAEHAVVEHGPSGS